MFEALNLIYRAHVNISIAHGKDVHFQNDSWFMNNILFVMFFMDDFIL